MPVKIPDSPPAMGILESELIATGTPVEQLPFEEVDCWLELVEVMDWAKSRTPLGV